MVVVALVVVTLQVAVVTVVWAVLLVMVVATVGRVVFVMVVVVLNSSFSTWSLSNKVYIDLYNLELIQYGIEKHLAFWWQLENFKSLILEKLNLLTCADSSTDTKNPRNLKK